MRVIGVIVIVLLAVSCSGAGQEALEKTMQKEIGMPNPASVKCHDDGHKLKIRKDAQGNEYGVCINAQGKECDEWAYFRGECEL